MKVMRVIEAFSTDIDGVPRVFTEGMLLKSSDPVCKGRDRFLMDAEVFTERSLGTETTSAAPGERRSLRDTLKRSASRAQKRAEEANPTGADDGEADPESGSNQVRGVNKKGEDGDDQTPEQKRSEKAALKVAEEVNRTGADDGQPDPESGPSQVEGVNYRDGYEVDVDVTTNEGKETPADVQKMAEEANRVGADDGEADPESGSNQVPGVNRVDKNDPDLPVDEEPAGKKEPKKATAKKTAAKKATGGGSQSS